LPEHEDFRIEKLARLRAGGIDPHGSRFPGARSTEEIRNLCIPENEGLPVRAAGRITNIRWMGKATFIDIQDWTGRVQVYIKKNKVSDARFEEHKLLDLGDIIGVDGGLAKTKTGEVTIFADNFTLLTKALISPPEKWHGLKDVEIRYRRRYVDLFTNPEVMRTFLLRSHILRYIRNCMEKRGFVEVETPMMQSIPGGAAARPFITHHNALDMDLFLRVAPELYLKRLLVGGMERVFEINRNFRNEGISTRHNPEFTMMEAYQAYADYTDMMELTESVISGIARDLIGSLRISFGDIALDMTPPWARRCYSDLLQEYAGVRLGDSEAITSRVRMEPALAKVDVKNSHPDVLANELFEELVEPRLSAPTFVIDYPKSLCPLTKACAAEPELAQRFELYIAGMECANAYSELNDPEEQEKRFVEQVGDADERERIDRDFLDAQGYGMPPAGGLGIGIDRIVMILTNNASIRDVILFPLLRRETDESKNE